MTQEEFINELINGVKSALPNGTYSEREMQLAFFMFSQGYQYAFSTIKGEIEREINNKEKTLEHFSDEDYVSSVASTLCNINIGLGLVREMIDEKLND